MLAGVPMMHTWDDHDYGPNDSNKNSPSREASLRNFRELVPHYPLTMGETGDGPVDQVFPVGRVTFILSDLRSERVSGSIGCWCPSAMRKGRFSGNSPCH